MPEFPPSQLMPPVSLAAARGIYDLLANPGRGKVCFSKIENSLKKSAVEKGFLLPPSPEDPSILPGELSPGEEAKLAAAFAYPAF